MRDGPESPRRDGNTTVAMGLAAKCTDPEDAAALRATETHALTSAIVFKWLACESCRAGLD